MLTLRPRFFELVCEFYKSRLCHKGKVDMENACSVKTS